MSTAAVAKTVLEYLKARRRLVAVSTLSVVATVFLSVALSYHLAVTRIQAVSSFHQETVAETHRSDLSAMFDNQYLEAEVDLVGICAKDVSTS